jgi:hypothetical protein
MNVNITLTNGSEVIPGNGTPLLLSFESGQRNVSLKASGNVTLQGDIRVEGPNVVSVTLLDNSKLTGAATMAVETGNRWVKAFDTCEFNPSA